MTSKTTNRQPQDPAMTDQRQTDIERWVKRVAYIIVGFWVGFPIIAMLFSEVTKRGQFGDSYGMITSLFTGFTIIGLVYTILLQREDIRIARSGLQKQHEDLELNRAQMILNRTEMQVANEQFKRQNRNVKYQRFETTFFRLLDQYHTLNKQQYKGQYDLILSIVTPQAIVKDFDKIQHAYRIQGERDVQNALSANIKSFEAIVKFIDDNKQRAGNRLKYFRLFFSQLSPNELWVFFYHFRLREEKLPVAFAEYQDQFYELHMTAQNNYGHYILIWNGTKTKEQKEGAQERRARLKRQQGRQ